jgi:cation transport ATPase
MKKLLRFAKRYRLFFGAFFGAIVAFGLDVGELDTAAHWVLIAVCALELLPLVWGMLRDIRVGTYGVDILAAAAIITSVLMKEYWAGTVIVLMLTGGEALEDYAEGRAKKELDALLKRAPQKAQIMRGRPG